MADDASPECFHDANQTIPTPEPTPAPAARVVAGENTFGGDSTPSPLQQRQLFPTIPSDGGTPQYLCWPMASGGQGQEPLNMRDVVEEEAVHGEGNSIADASESAELEEALEDSLRDRLLVLTKNKHSEEEVSDCEKIGLY